MPPSLRPRTTPTALAVAPADERLDPEVLAELRRHLAADEQDLVRCCRWLGGERWAARAETLATLAERAAAGASHGGALLARLLGRIHALLALELVDDLGSDEAARFAALDLDDARVGRCCVHAERIGALLGRVGSARPAPDAAGGRAGPRRRTGPTTAAPLGRRRRGVSPPQSPAPGPPRRAGRLTRRIRRTHHGRPS